MRCGDKMVDEGFNFMKVFGGCHVALLPEHHEEEEEEENLEQPSWLSDDDRKSEEITPEKKR